MINLFIHILYIIESVSVDHLQQKKQCSKALVYFTTSLRNIFDVHAPITSKRVKGKGCPWITVELKFTMAHNGHFSSRILISLLKHLLLFRVIFISLPSFFRVTFIIEKRAFFR